MLRLAPSVYVPGARRMHSPATACESADVSAVTVLTLIAVGQAAVCATDAVMLTVEVSALVASDAMTRNVPVVLPAVYMPVEEIDPPVAEYATAGVVVDPSLQVTAALNCAVVLGASVVLAGEIVTEVSVGVAVTGAVIVTTDESALDPPCWVATTRNVPAVVPAV